MDWHLVIEGNEKSQSFSGSWFCSLSWAASLLSDIDNHAEHLAACPTHWSLTASAPATDTAHGHIQNLGRMKWHVLSQTNVPVLLALSAPCFHHPHSLNMQGQTSSLSHGCLSAYRQGSQMQFLLGPAQNHAPHHKISKHFLGLKGLSHSNNFRPLFTNIFRVQNA